MKILQKFRGETATLRHRTCIQGSMADPLQPLRPDPGRSFGGWTWLDVLIAAAPAFTLLAGWLSR